MKRDTQVEVEQYIKALREEARRDQITHLCIQQLGEIEELLAQANTMSELTGSAGIVIRLRRRLAKLIEEMHDDLKLEAESEGL